LQHLHQQIPVVERVNEGVQLPGPFGDVDRLPVKALQPAELGVCDQHAPVTRLSVGPDGLPAFKKGYAPATPRGEGRPTPAILSFLSEFGHLARVTGSPPDPVPEHTRQTRARKNPLARV
jgi:hypothetical protein